MKTECTSSRGHFHHGRSLKNQDIVVKAALLQTHQLWGRSSSSTSSLVSSFTKKEMQKSRLCSFYFDSMNAETLVSLTFLKIKRTNEKSESYAANENFPDLYVFLFSWPQNGNPKMRIVMGCRFTPVIEIASVE